MQSPSVPSAPLALAAGDRFACAIGADHTLWCWGDNGSAQLGLGDTTARVGAQHVPLPRPVVAMSAGGSHACAVLDDATVWCWGDNGYGASGQDMSIPLVPTPAQVLDRTAQITSGNDFTCALRIDRSVWCWGGNTYGDLGDGTYNSRETPMAIAGITADAIAGGDFHACVLIGGAYSCWGSDNEGEVGFASQNAATNTPGPVSTMTGFTKVVAGAFFTCAIRDAGDVYCFGDDHEGALGLGDTYGHDTPLQVDLGGAHAIDLTGGGVHACAILATGMVKCWGRGSNGELGNGTSAELVPQMVSLPAAATAIAAGDSHVCTIAGGATYCWGDDDGFQLGSDAPDAAFAISTPVQVPGLASSTALACGNSTTCVLDSGNVVCFGNDFGGPLGDSGAGVSEPVTVPGLPAPVTALAMGGAFGCADANGNAWCWGDDQYGQLGDNGALGQNQPPTQVAGVANLTAIAASYLHACALDASNGLWCWGSNGAGELGLGTSSSTESAMQVAGAWTQVAADGESTCGITGGQVECWGYNPSAGLGDGTQSSSDVPIATVPVVAASKLSMHAGEICAVTSAGISCWGPDDVGQLGDGALTTQLSPKPIEMAGATEVAVGAGFACAIVSGKVLCWGDNAFGQLGNGRFSRSLVPVDVMFP